MNEDGGSPVERRPSMLEHDVGLAPHELSEQDERLQMLQERFFDIADTSTAHAPETLDYIRGGGSLRLCLLEIMALSEPCAEEQANRQARTKYMDYIFQRRGLRRREERKRIFRGAEEDYIDSVVAKLSAMIDADTHEKALELGQMPTLIENASFRDEQELSEEFLAANHLYLLVDTALKEHVHRRRTIDRVREQKPLARLLGNRMLQLATAGSVFAVAISPRLGVLPTHGDQIAENVELGMKVLSGTILGVTAPEAVRLQYLQFTHDHRTDELQDQLAGSQRLSDQALRMTYSSTRYGNPDGTKRVTGRSGTADKEENLRRFARLDREFPHLNNDPGGKPYTGEQALGYAARLLIERKEQLSVIIAPGKSAEERKEKYLELAREILTEDVIRMKKGLNVSRIRRRVIGALAVIPAVIFPSAASSANDASTLGRDTVSTLSHPAEEDAK